MRFGVIGARGRVGNLLVKDGVEIKRRFVMAHQLGLDRNPAGDSHIDNRTNADDIDIYRSRYQSVHRDARPPLSAMDRSRWEHLAVVVRVQSSGRNGFRSARWVDHGTSRPLALSLNLLLSTRGQTATVTIQRGY